MTEKYSFRIGVGLMLLVAAALTPLCPPARAEVVDAIAAVVNGHVITKSEIDTELARGGANLTDQGLRREVLENLIERSLIEERARKMRISVPDDELRGMVVKIRDQFGLDESSFRKAILQQGISWETYLVGVKNELLRVKIFSMAMGEELKLDDTRLKEYFLKNSEAFRKPTTVRLLHASFPARSGQADLVRDKVRAGADFATAVTDISGHPPSDTGYMSLSKLSEIFRMAISSLPAGTVSETIPTPDGDYLLFLAERTEGSLPDFEQVKDMVRERFTNAGQVEVYKNWMEQQKRQANIQRMM